MPFSLMKNIIGSKAERQQASCRARHVVTLRFLASHMKKINRPEALEVQETFPQGVVAFVQKPLKRLSNKGGNTENTNVQHKNNLHYRTSPCETL